MTKIDAARSDPQAGGDFHDEGRRPTAACLKVSQLLGRIGDKWAVLVIMSLRERPRRFNELKRGIGGISQRMLTLTLRNMERDGLVGRTVTPSIPPRVDYQLTEMGLSLSEPLEVLGNWAFGHVERIGAAQAEYDGRVGAATFPGPGELIGRASELPLPMRSIERHRTGRVRSGS